MAASFFACSSAEPSMTTLSSSGARLIKPRFNPLKKPLMTMRPAAIRKNHQGVDIVDGVVATGQ